MKINNVIFKTIYFIDSVPHSLAIGVVNENLFFEIPIEKGFRINTFLDKNTYNKICKILGITFDQDNPFSSKKFFDEIHKQIPTSVSLNNVPKSSDIAPFKNDVEEADKIYFCG